MVINKVRKTIDFHKLIEKKQHIVVGLSGGPDSVCLFDVLLKLKDIMDICIYPVHVNHKLRPEDAEKDQQYVESLCIKNGVKCRTFIVDCNELARKCGITSEEAGRKARYEAFYKTASDICSNAENRISKTNVKIAVAHNADDQAETILFRLMRGTGVDGIAGISYKRQERGFDVIRPVLDITRKEIEEYCMSNGLNPVIDKTNREEIYTRNKIRLSLIPFIEREFNENIKESMVRLGRIAASDKEYLWQEAVRRYEEILVEEVPKERGKESGIFLGFSEIILDREGLSRTHESLRHRIILNAFGKIGLDKDISQERIKAADFIINRKQSPKTVEFPHGYKLCVARGQVRFFISES